MKQLIIFLIMFVAAVASAESMFDDMTKEQLAEYRILVIHQPSGKKIGDMSRAEYKVVKIGEAAAAAEQQVAVQTQVVEVPVQRLNRVRLMGGVGPSNKIDKEVNGSTMTVRTKNDAVLGFGLDHMLDERWSGNGQVLTNGTFMLGVGYDY